MTLKATPVLPTPVVEPSSPVGADRAVSPSAPVDARQGAGPVRAWAGKRPGRSHVRHGTPCQDAFAVHRDAASGRVAAAVADGLGSRPLSHLGSQAACDAAVASLAAEPAAAGGGAGGGWDEAALRRAFRAARAAVAAAAAERGLQAEDLATTLQVTGLEPSPAAGGMGWRTVGAIVGDGAIVTAAGGKAELLLEPAPSPYANLVVPLTADEWEDSFRFAEREGSGTALVFTDGLTRLLLTKSRDGWALFPPFFDAFLPQVASPAAGEDLVSRFLGSEPVDASWDDDKCLVVLHAPSITAPPAQAGGEP